MPIPVNALPADRPLEPTPPASPPPKNAGVVREVVAPDGMAKSPGPTAGEKSDALAEINQSLKMACIGVRFEFDKQANTLVTQVVDAESGELIRQMPSEEVVRIAKAMNSLKGLLFARAA
jgi:flagellar protein FlaG